MRWKLYWGGLSVLLLGTALVRNSHKYRARSRKWIAGKSLVDIGLAGLLCWIATPLMVSLTTLWGVKSFVKDDPVWKTVVGVCGGMALMALAPWCLEALAFTGVISIDVVTGKFFKYAEADARRHCERRMLRTVENAA